MRKKFAGIVGMVIVLLLSIRTGALAKSARDIVVEYAQEIYDYTWTTSNMIPRYNATKSPFTVTGSIKGIPYCWEHGCMSFEDYKALSTSSKEDEYSSGQMRYGMQCATLVTDCIRQGLTNEYGQVHLPIDNQCLFHHRGSWKGKGYVRSVSDVATDAYGERNFFQSDWVEVWTDVKGEQENAYPKYPAYRELQKGDYLDNYYHVLLVIENDPETETITYIDQTSCWDTVDKGMVGPHRGTYTYESLSEHMHTVKEGKVYAKVYAPYVPMRVTYPDDNSSPVSDTPAQDLSDINPGLRNLTSSSYAKVFTLTSGRYDVYRDSSLTTKLSSTAWTGEDDEDWITGVGKNSSGTIYARISYPTGSSRQTAYASLKDVFVPGTLNNDAKSAVASHYGLYKRKNSGQDNSCGIDVGDSVYLLTKEDSWCQVLYPVGAIWRIAWLPESDYNKVVGVSQEVQQERQTAPRIITMTLPDAYIGENYNANLSAQGSTPITWECRGSTASLYGFLLEGKNFIYTSTNGIINGTITNPSSRTTPFSVSIQVTATNSIGSASRTYTVTVREKASSINDDRSRNLDNNQDFPNINWNNQSNGNSDTHSFTSSSGGGGCSYGFSTLCLMAIGLALVFKHSR